MRASQQTATEPTLAPRLATQYRRKPAHVAYSLGSVDLIVPKTKYDASQLIYVIGLDRVLAVTDQ